MYYDLVYFRFYDICADMEQGVNVIVRESKAEMMPADSRFMGGTPFLRCRLFLHH